MSDTNYRAGDMYGGRTTSGWFLLGFPIFIVFAQLAVLLFSFVARLTRPVGGWVCLLGVFVPLIVNAVLQTTPAARLRSVLKVGLPVGIHIQRLDQHDSFNDGSTFWGVCSADARFVDQLVAVHALTTSDSRAVFRDIMPEETILTDGRVFSGRGLTILYDVDRSLLFFYRNEYQPRP